MSWNYRVVRYANSDSEPYLIIKEVYYDENSKIKAFGDAPVPYGDTKEEIREVLKMMMDALDKDIIDRPE